LISQNQNKITLSHNTAKCGGGYLASLTEALKAGMTLIVSHWSGATGSDMGWLDMPPCSASEGCDKSGTAMFYDIYLK